MTQWGLDTLFNPSKRHMDEEKRRLQATRQQVGDTSGGKRIDLESGKVRIGKKADGEPETDGANPADGDQTPDHQTPDAQTPDDQTPDDRTAAAEKKPARERSARSKSAAKKATPKKGTPEKKLSPAQIRAAERRGRTPR